ncbi:hypothetical protein [Novacetimonas pomaceti]|uniref:hypothetical protein n=1 Tax=Novacetimonas pomaceti TaxID=2021998 RepID=UPI0014041C16|nr:hypothetical protein [Novacetimonas pomaceti]MBV1833111.1 hypothetical protein [Novacetimonas pomaceti]
MKRVFGIFILLPLAATVAGCHDPHRSRHPIYWHEEYDHDASSRQHPGTNRR